jgi:hypothetical protein
VSSHSRPSIDDLFRLLQIDDLMGANSDKLKELINKHKLPAKQE